LIELRPPSGSQLEKSFSARSISPRLPSLTKHEIVQARVIHPYTDRGAIIAIKQRNVIARSHVPLEKDQLLLLRVEHTSPTPRLSLLGVTGRSAGPSILLQAVEQNLWRQVMETLARSATTAEEGRVLRELLKDLSSFFRAGGRHSMREWIGKSGLVWENKLRVLCLQGRGSAEDLNRVVAGDLKGALARMVKKEQAAAPLIERLLNVIESMQCFNSGIANQSGKLLFLIPCQFPDGFWTVAQLVVQNRQDGTRKGSGKGRSCRIVLFVQLERLGFVRAEMAIQDKEVRIAFLSESPQSRSRLEAHLHVLIDRLQDRGFRVGEATCEVGDRDLLRKSLVLELADAGDHSFSTFV
jgi:hypothetical protein